MKPGHQEDFRLSSIWLHGSRVVVLLATIVTGFGCDDHQADPPPPAPTPVIHIPQRPTTQQILTAPHKPLQFFTFPLIMDVPDLAAGGVHTGAWRIPSSNSLGSGLSVEGPAPSGDVVLQLVPLPGEHPKSAIPMVEAAALKERAANPTTVLMAEARSVGPVRLIEKRIIQHLPESMQEFPKPGSMTGETERRRVPATDFIDWSIRVFYPTTGGKFLEGSIIFAGLTREQYEKDRAFLEQLVGTLRYDPAHSDLP